MLACVVISRGLCFFIGLNDFFAKVFAFFSVSPYNFTALEC
jgi:hypothetical protein